MPMKKVDWVAKPLGVPAVNELRGASEHRNVSAEVANRTAWLRSSTTGAAYREWESDFEAEVKRTESKRPRKGKEEP